MKKFIGIGAAGLALSFSALAQQVPVYPGAKADPETAEVLKKQMQITAQTYRTSDSVEKVSQFYKAQKLKEMPGADKKSAGFTAADGAHVTIQNPWLDMKNGKMNNDTLISIVKKASR